MKLIPEGRLAALAKELKTEIGRTCAQWAARQAMNIPQPTLVETLYPVVDSCFRALIADAPETPAREGLREAIIKIMADSTEDIDHLGAVADRILALTRPAPDSLREACEGLIALVKMWFSINQQIPGTIRKSLIGDLEEFKEFSLRGASRRDDSGLREAAWLIELPTTPSPRWLTAKGTINWTFDSNEALRFSRKQDAEDLIASHDILIHTNGVFASEHIWLENVGIPRKVADHIDAALRGAPQDSGET
jgi:hypothetical protein